MRTSTWLAFGAAAILGFMAGCMVDLPSNGNYTCATNADCGGGGYICTPDLGALRPSHCCLPSGTEVCDGTDNDCDGISDNIAQTPCYTGDAGTQGVGPCDAGVSACQAGKLICFGQTVDTDEVCNTKDDNCDGQINEGFDFLNDKNNCGVCGRGCAGTNFCFDGGCAVVVETICSDGVDNDGDGPKDCADNDCDGGSCGTGCQCRQGSARETACSDTLDNDSDTFFDCADGDCDGGSCGTGCQCVAGAPKEMICSDALDNDSDTFFDCADSNCDGGLCNPDGGGGCQCVGGLPVEQNCFDGFDNDNDGLVDCADSDCPNGSCGAGCLCTAGVPHETVCSDTLNNDNDGFADCGDSDCDGGSCGAGCQCRLGVKAETICSDGINNDAPSDALTDCADSDCDGGSCAVGGGCTCIGGIKHETNCQQENPASGDEDGDGLANCADVLDCPLGTLCRGGSATQKCTASFGCQ